jgi:acetyl esterase/lipase
MLYRGMDRAELDRAYDIQGAMEPGTLSRHVADWQARGAAVMARGDGTLDLRYGPAPRQRLDFFRADAADRPTLAFIHGGYWQRQDKETYRFIAEGPLARGINFANIEYTLAPERGMDAIVAEIEQSLAWLGDNLARLGGAPGALYVAGHSAGGHLCARTIGAPGVRGGLAISGIFDLEPIWLGALNDAIGMDEAEARRSSPLFHVPASAPPLAIAFGEKELPELCRQSRDYHAAWAANGLPGRLMPLAGHDHFSILDELAKPAGALLAALVAMIGPHTHA